jgi:hypothetical protein
MPQPNDFLVKREQKQTEAHPGEGGAEFAWFGPLEAHEQRHRFLVVKEAGDDVSLVPGTEAKFKVGLKALRWKGAKSEDPKEVPGTYLVVKTTGRRVDLKKLKA